MTQNTSLSGHIPLDSHPFALNAYESFIFDKYFTYFYDGGHKPNFHQV